MTDAIGRNPSKTSQSHPTQQQQSKPRRIFWLSACIPAFLLSIGISESQAFVLNNNRNSKQNAVAFRRTPTTTALGVSSLKENVEKWNRIWMDDAEEEESFFPFQSSSFSLPSVNDIPQEYIGLLALGTVPILWGTYGPIVRSMYELEIPVPGFIFSSCYFTMSAITTIALALLQDESFSLKKLEEERKLEEENANFGEKLVGLFTETMDFGSDATSVDVEVEEVRTRSLGEKLKGIFTDVPTLLGGLELGFYVLMANCFHVIGLETVSSDKAGFLLQMTTVLVPLVSAVMARNPKAVDGTTWLACSLAFLGIITMNVDPMQDSALSILSSFSGGEGLVIGAALMYSMNIIRIGDYAGQTEPLRLTAVKATVEAVLSWSIVAATVFLVKDVPEVSTLPQNGVLAFAESTGTGVVDFFNAFSARLEEGSLSSDFFAKFGGAVAWAGVMGNAAVIMAQAYGQRLVKPSDANLIYSLQPIFTAMFATMLLGEQMDSKGFLGGGIILSAVLMVATKNMGSEEETEAASVQRT